MAANENVTDTATPTAPAAPLPTAAAPGAPAFDPAVAALLANRSPTKTMNAAVDARVHAAWTAWTEANSAPKGRTLSLAMQRFLESNGVVIPGLTQSLP